MDRMDKHNEAAKKKARERGFVQFWNDGQIVAEFCGSHEDTWIVEEYGECTSMMWDGDLSELFRLVDDPFDTIVLGAPSAQNKALNHGYSGPVIVVRYEQSRNCH